MKVQRLLRAFVRGFASINLFPPSLDVKVPELDARPGWKRDREALRRDWERVLGDLNKPR